MSSFPAAEDPPSFPYRPIFTIGDLPMSDTENESQTSPSPPPTPRPRSASRPRLTSTDTTPDSPSRNPITPPSSIVSFSRPSTADVSPSTAGGGRPSSNQGSATSPLFAIPDGRNTSTLLF